LGGWELRPLKSHYQYIPPEEGNPTAWEKLWISSKIRDVLKCNATMKSTPGNEKAALFEDMNISG